jgi:aspartokinase
MVYFVKIRTNTKTTEMAIESTEKTQPTYFERERGVTEIRVETGFALFIVSSPDRLGLLQQLAAAHIPINQVKFQTNGLSFVVRENHASACATTLRDGKFSYTHQPSLALLRTVAGAMRDLSGVVAQIYEALNRINVPVRLVGDAYDSVFGLVAAADAGRAETALNQQFGINEEAA